MGEPLVRAPAVDVAAAIIAGGEARRLGGRVKALIEIEGRSVLDRQLDVLAPRCAAIAISCNDAAPFRDRSLPVIPDRQPGLGPLAGIAAALAWCPAPYLLVVAGDMPYIDPAIVDLLLARRGEADAIVPFIAGLPEPLFAVYGRTCLPVAEQRLAAGRRKAAGLVDAALAAGLSVRRVDEAALRAVDPRLRCFTNVNTLADLPPGTA
ncbi:MAG TPA: molybdenum cofactor guanylyltransferase [Haliangium sp.]|nr:molybdenum cofactor guanylyltransferase [Haliangium sp.]